jgi:acyl-CoA thioesterase I
MLGFCSAGNPQVKMQAVKRNLLVKTVLALFCLLPFLYPVNSPLGNNIKTEDLTVVALGDSITWGYPNGESWTGMVANDTGLRIINRGVNGSTLKGMLNRMPTDVLPVKPSICIIMGGTNDVYHGFTGEKMLENIQTMAHELLSRNIMPVIGLPIPLAEQGPENKLRELRMRILASSYLTIDFAADFELPWADFRRLVPDGIHPTREGKKMMAERLKKELPRLLAAYAKFRK